jgi:hypothetical protein
MSTKRNVWRSQAEANAPAPRATLGSASRSEWRLSTEGASLAFSFDKGFKGDSCSSLAKEGRYWDMMRGDESVVWCVKRTLYCYCHFSLTDLLVPLPVPSLTHSLTQPTTSQIHTLHHPPLAPPLAPQIPPNYSAHHAQPVSTSPRLLHRQNPA